MLVTVATESRQQLYCSTLTEPEANSLADFTKLLSFDMVRTSKEGLQSLQVVVSEVNELHADLLHAAHGCCCNVTLRLASDSFTYRMVLLQKSFVVLILASVRIMQ